jgi:hypothetical protein
VPSRSVHLLVSGTCMADTLLALATEHVRCLPGIRGTVAMCVRVAVPTAAKVRGANPLGTSVRMRSGAMLGAPRRRQRCARAIGVPGKLGRGRPQPDRMPRAGGVSGTGYGRARTGAVCARDGPRPDAACSGLPGAAGEERSRAQVPGSGVLVHKAAPGRPGVIGLRAYPGLVDAGRDGGRSAVVTGGRQPRLVLLAGAQRAPGFFVVDRMSAYA